MYISLLETDQQINNRRSKLDCMLIYNIINKLTICLLLKIPEKGIYYTVDNRDMVL